MITRPRLFMTTSLSTGGRPRSSNLGMVVVMVRITMPTLPCCTKQFTRKRPMPAGAMAKLHSLVASNSAACLSFIIARTRSAVCWPVSFWSMTGVILPSSFIAGGKSAVINRSDPFLLSISRSRSYMNFVDWPLSISHPTDSFIQIYPEIAPPAGHVLLTLDPGSIELSLRCDFRSQTPSAAGKVVLIRGFAARFGARNHVFLHQILQILVQCLHAELLAGLDCRIHLRDLGFADQVADGGRADHDFVGRDPPRTVLGLEQRLRDNRLQGLGDHRAYHLLFRRREHINDAVDGLRRRTRVQGAKHQVADR